MTTDRWVRMMMVILAIIAVFATLSVASTVFAPVACALFIIALVWPMQRHLQASLPRLLALAIVIAVTVAIFSIFALLVSWGFGRVGRALIADAARFQSIYEQLAAWLETHGIVLAGIWAEHFDIRWLVRTFQGITARLNTTVTFWLVVIVYVILGLLEVHDVSWKLEGLRARLPARIVLDGSARVAAKFRHYMLIRTVMSLVTGMLVWALAAALGLELAAEWGVIAFTLNYIPFIGPFIATMFPTLYALAQFESWQAALLVFACLNVIQFVIGSYIEPRVAGKALVMSPFLVLFSVFFWTYLWGFFGAFIGVPIAIALVTFCSLHPSSRWVADLFGAPEIKPRV